MGKYKINEERINAARKLFNIIKEQDRLHCDFSDLSLNLTKKYKWMFHLPFDLLADLLGVPEEGPDAEIECFTTLMDSLNELISMQRDGHYIKSFDDLVVEIKKEMVEKYGDRWTDPLKASCSA